MDGLAALLDGPRARGAFLLRCVMDAPWAVRLEDEAPLTLLSVSRGGLWLWPEDGAPPLRLGPGDVVVRVGTAPWFIGDDPRTPPMAVILPGQVCVGLDGRPLREELSQGLRTWGTGASGETAFIIGVYLVEGEVPGRLLRALPGLLVVRAGELDSSVATLLEGEIDRQVPGQEAVLDRLLDLLLITVLRHWLDRAEDAAPRWYAGQADPVVGPALRLVQHHPEQPWTVAGLAAAAHVSRSAFARRFTTIVGQTPVAFLTEWRLALAADLMLDESRTLASVARQVGYGTPFALSAAFRRERGVSPQQWRRSRRVRAVTP